MSIWNKILVGFVITAALAFFYLAMRTLKTHQYWRNTVRNLEKRIEEEAKIKEELIAGGQGEGEQLKLGIRQVDMLLHKLLIDRGRVWNNCDPRNVNGQTGQVSVAIDVPGGGAHGIGQGAPLYVFEDKEIDQEKGGGRYLGTFEVEAVDAAQVALKPARKMGPRELQRLSQASKPWVIYERMPIDNRDAFAELTEAEKKKILPAKTVADYVHDGEAATWEQIEQWGATGLLIDEKGKVQLDDKGEKIAGAKGNYFRTLRDYDALFKLHHTQRTELNDLIASMERDIRYLQTSIAEAKLQVESRKTELAGLKVEFAKIDRERNAVKAHFAKVKAQAAGIEASVKQLLADNLKLTYEIARMQIEAAQKIDARTRAMAQTQEAGKP